MNMNIEQAYRRAITEVFEDSGDIYTIATSKGIVASIESGSVPSLSCLAGQQRWLQVQHLTQQYSGSYVFLEAVNDAQVAIYEV
jgi:homoserine kinase